MGPTPWCPPICNAADQFWALAIWYMLLWVFGFWGWLLGMVKEVAGVKGPLWPSFTRLWSLPFSELWQLVLDDLRQTSKKKGP